MRICILFAFLATLAIIVHGAPQTGPKYVSSIFRNISRSAIIKVPVKRTIHRSKRSLDSYRHELKFSAFGQDFSLYLESAGHVLLGTNTKVFSASSNYGGNIHYQDLGDILNQLKYRPLQDPNNNAAAIEFEGPNGRQVEGFLNDTYIFSTDDDDNDDDINIARIPEQEYGGLSNDFKDFDFNNFPNYPNFPTYYPPSNPGFNNYHPDFPSHPPSRPDFSDYHPDFPNHPPSRPDFNDYNPNYPSHPPSRPDFNDYNPNYPSHPPSKPDFSDYNPNFPNYPTTNFDNYNPNSHPNHPPSRPDFNNYHPNNPSSWSPVSVDDTGDSSTFWGSNPTIVSGYNPNNNPGFNPNIYTEYGPAGGSSVNEFNNQWQPTYTGYGKQASDSKEGSTLKREAKEHSKNMTIIRRLSLPSTVYLEVLVVLDNSFYREFGSDNKEMVKYAAGFWNAVDLRFRQLSQPQLRLSIKGIIIANDPGATPYIVIRNGNIHGESTLDRMADLDIARKLPAVSYDIMMAMTKRPMFGDNGPGDIIQADGFAFLSSACAGTSHLPRTIDFQIDYPFDFDSNRRTGGIIRDLGLYTGTSTAAHEIAHMLGARHDRDESQIRRMACPEEAGFIMNAGGQPISNAGINRWRFSPCSHAAIREFFHSGQGECMYNKPNIGSPISKPLPGTETTLTQQCQSVFGPDARASRSGNSACEMLFCAKYGHPEELTTYEPPAEGSVCEKGSSKICINGRCVPKPAELNNN